jgi:hypothetical protein
MKLTVKSGRRAASYPASHDVTEYIRQAEALGLKVPAKVAKAHQEARAFRAMIQEAEDGAQPLSLQDVGARLGSGAIDLEEADRLLPAVATLGPRAYVEARKKMLAAAAEAASVRARDALAEQGDKLLEPLRTIAQESLDYHRHMDSSARWKAAHSLAQHLRKMHAIPRVDGLPSVAETEQAYQLANLDEAHRWQDENRDPNTGKRPGLTFQAIAANRERFGAGLYTAADVVHHSEAWDFEPEPVNV